MASDDLRARRAALEQRVRATLQRSGLRVVEGASVSGVPVDFALELPTGGTAVVELKAWTAADYNRFEGWADTLARRFEELGVPTVTVLDETHGRYCAADSFVFEGQLRDFVQGRWADAALAPTPGPGAAISRPAAEIFEAMPFAPEYSDAFWNAIRPAAVVVKSSAYREDYSGAAGDVLVRIREHIERSTFVAADVSQLRPNVMFEVGWGLAHLKSVVFMAERGTTLPYDI